MKYKDSSFDAGHLAEKLANVRAPELAGELTSQLATVSKQYYAYKGAEMNGAGISSSGQCVSGR